MIKLKIIKMVTNTMRLGGGVLATVAATAFYFGAASGVWAIVGFLAALSYTIADGIDLYGLIKF